MEEKIDFDKIYDRRGTDAIKHELLSCLFGRDDLIPLWIADMDFPVSKSVLQGVEKRLTHPIFGYTLPSLKLYESTLSWFKRRHDLKLEKDKVVFTSGVISSFFGTLLSLGERGDSVIIPTPSYPPFFSITKSAGLEVLTTDLLDKGDEYTFNFEEIRKLAKKAKFFILCNPHNPTGRAWREEELLELVKIALENNLIILSDDIHADFVFQKNYLPLSKIAPRELNFISAYSAGKTFNIPGMGLGLLHFSSLFLKEKVEAYLDATHLNHINPITMSIYEEVYSSGDEWVDQMLSYLKKNRDLAFDSFAGTKIKVYRPDATMLMWLDCRALELSPKKFFLETCHLALNDGVSFGDSFSGFMRLNIATQRSVLSNALALIKDNLISTNHL